MKATRGDLELDVAVANAIEAARLAGRVQRERRATGVRVEAKGDADITTDVDAECERLIFTLLRQRHSDWGLLGEEGTDESAALGHEVLWVVDPLDGTKNYSHGLPRSCVSIALVAARRPVVGVVFNPWAGELFVAVKGRGATRNGESIRVSAVDRLDRAMVATAIAYDGHKADRAQLERVVRVFEAVQAVRSLGCAALELCDVACGRLDAFFEPGLKAWDVAAGSLMVEEAGGTVSRFDGGEMDLWGGECVAGGVVVAALTPHLVPANAAREIAGRQCKATVE